MTCLPMNHRQSLICRIPLRVALLRLMLVCVIAACAFLAAQTPDIASLRKRAKDGDAEAQYLLSSALLSGNGVARDSKQGVEWLKRAADQDHPAAQQVLSYMYLKGGEQNIPKNPKLGLEWLQKSADHGNAAAEFALAVMYRDGDGETGISRNPHEAAAWFRKAARQPGSIKSQTALEEMLKKHLILEQEANWHPPFSLGEVEAGLKGWITSNRMATLVQKFGVDFKMNTATQKRLIDDGASAELVQAISASRRSL